MMLSTPKRKIDWWIYSVPVILILQIVFYILVYSRLGGTKAVLLFYLAPFVVITLCLLFLLIGIIRSAIRRPFFTRSRLISFTDLLLLLFSGSFYGAYPSSYDNKPSKVEFCLPLDTTITVAWGGGREEINYHVLSPDQRWAYDLFIMKDGKTFLGDSSKLSSYYCYGRPVLSPAAGKVAEVLDSDPDMPAGTLGGGTEPTGNHIIIEVAPKEYLFLCHLQPKSIKVKKGDLVERGQPVALVGNSGNTSEPHIHVHLQDTKMFGLGEGIPLYFYHYMTDGKTVEKGIPTGGFDTNGKFIGQTVQNIKRP